MESPDLFGDVPVSLRDLELWLYKIPRLHYRRTWRTNYVRQYDVIDKIKRFKLEGTFHDRLNGEECEFCGQVLAADLLPDCSDEQISANPRATIDRLKRRIAVLEMVLLAATLPVLRKASQPIR